ncbi:MAG: hypothetical protein WCP89_00945 [archaeon]
MKKIIIITLIVLLALSLLLIVAYQGNLTGRVIENSLHTYTKAICNSTNYCQDYEISCDGNRTLNINPITGAAVQHVKEWIDPRNNKTKEILCPA